MAAIASQAQTFEQRGFVENRLQVFPQSAPNDRAQAVDQMTVRWESAYRPAPWLRLNVSFDARADTHRQVDRQSRISLDDRRIARPALNARLWSVQLSKGPVTFEVGRQLIRWGKTDALPITDRFAPRDYLSSVVDSDFLAVPAARLTIAGAHDTLDLIYQPWFVPSRTPLLDQRWTVLPGASAGISFGDAGARYPGGAQFGARWNRTTGPLDYSLSYFRGRANLPLFEAVPRPTDPVAIRRFYPTMEMYGADAAWQAPWVTLKGEAGYFTTKTQGAEEFWLYAIQAERQVKEVSLAAGYAGSVITSANPASPQFAPDRGLAGSVIGRIFWTIDVNRSLTFDTAVRRNGSFTRIEFSQAIGGHWRISPGFVWLRGDPADFLGQFRRNSYFSLALRYSF
ncbi:MAG: hypothetical protein SFV18_13420 [Bryobacteraceae bacterium]|nr:hypothetical protein [Bryobacteraceae bacterium]